jgi:hypothetical protein
MQNRILCGTYRVSERTEYNDSSFECAAWWRTIIVEPGDYPVYGYLHGGSMDFCARFEGVILEDNFQSLWGGLPVGNNYDQTQNAGKPAVYSITSYDYNVFASIHKAGDNSPWRIDFSTIPFELSNCTDCGCVIRKYTDSARCPSCSVELDRVRKNHACQRHRFLLSTAYGLRTTRFSSYLDTVIAGANADQGSRTDDNREILAEEVAAMRSAGPQGRIAARRRYPVPSYAFVVR